MKTYYAAYKVYLTDNSNYRLQTKYVFGSNKNEALARLLHIEPRAVEISIYEQS